VGSTVGFTTPAFSWSALDRHEARRGQGIPTISTLVGDATRAAQLWEAWALRDGGHVVVSAAATAKAMLDDIVRSSLGDRLRERLVERCAACRGVSAIEWWSNFGAKGERERRESLALVDDALLRSGDRSTGLLWGLIGAEFGRKAREAGPLAVFAACIELVAPDRLAVLLVPGIQTARSIETAGALVAAAPRANVAIALRAGDVRSLGSAAPRVATLLREGALRLPAIDGLLSEVAPRVPSPLPLGAAETDRARGRAERALFEALERSAATRGLFRLNQPLPLFFGGRAAEVDLLCLELKLAIEVDGYHHFREADDSRRDRRKDVLLQKDGFFVVRALAGDVMADPNGVAAAVREVVEHRRREG
jgi:very-short-patch-repair endonuclease